MPIIDKRDRNNWYNTVRVEGKRRGYDPFRDPHFDADKLKENEIIQPNGVILAKIPKIENRIYHRSPSDRSETYIELLTDYEKDPETGKTVAKKTIIGIDISGFLDGMMIINEHYHKYFDRKGNLIKDPLRERREREAKEKAEATNQTTEQTQNPKTNTQAANDTTNQTATGTTANAAANINTNTANTSNQTTPDIPQNPEERTVDEIKASLLEKEKLLDRQREAFRLKQQEAERLLQKVREQQEELETLIEERKYETREKEAAHLSLLDNILESYRDTVREQAKRKPDALMRLTQIRTINEILQELRNWFAGTEAEDYLHLAEEPIEDDLEHHPGTTYGEMAILLSAYAHTITACRCGRLYWKNSQSETDGER